MNPTENYNVTFFILEQYGMKRISTTNDWMSQFIGDHNRIDTATSVVNNIEKVLNGNQAEWIGENLSMQLIIVNARDTKIYQSSEDYYINPKISPDFILPTIDFKNIFESWINYLKS